MNSTHLIYFAPFQGITNQVFRSVYATSFHGVDKIFTPYFAGINKDNKLSAQKTKELCHTKENNTAIIPQILSKDANEIIRFAHIIDKMGFSELNWNLGCPAPQVASKKRGSGMLPYPEMVEDILSQLDKHLSIPFSIKCRLGFESAEEFNALIPVFNRHKISELIIHARIGKQLYKGNTDLDSLHQILPKLNLPVVYNGDIRTINDFQHHVKLFPYTTKWMIGRGILYNPYLPALIKGETLPIDQQSYVKKYLEELYIAYRKQMNDRLAVIGFLKEYWQYLAYSFGDAQKVFKKLKKVNSFNEYETAVISIFSEFEWQNQG